MKYQVGDIVQVIFHPGWRVAIVSQAKEIQNYENQYLLIICGEPHIGPQMYYESEIPIKLV